MAWCLTKQAENALLKALQEDGNPQKMVDRGTAGRLAWFEKYVGKENAQKINYLFETKMLLQSQQKGIESFVKSLGGSKQIQTDFLSKVGRLQKALSKKEVGQYLETFVNQRLGIDVTKEEYQAISDLSTKLSTLKESYDPKTMEWKSESDAAEFGATQQALNLYIGDLKSGNPSIKQMLKDRGYQFKEEFKQNFVKATAKLLLDTARQIADNSVSLVATFDNSYMGRQGIFTLLTGHPKVWGRAAIKSFGDIVKTLGGKKPDDALMAQVFSDPLYMNGEYQKAKIIDRIEEQYPTTIPQRIPILGRFLKAANSAFTNSGLRMRTDMYKILRDIKVSRGIDMIPDEIVGTGKIVNSLLARGDLGRAGSNSLLRIMMWAPKMLKADFDVLTAHAFEDLPKQDRKTVLGNLLKIIIATAIIEEIWKLTHPKESIELNPTSSDFLALKSGDTRIKYLRGIPAIITLISRIAFGGYKSTSTGEWVPYGTKIGQRTRLDALIQFLRGKAPPATGAIYNWLEGLDYSGKPPTFTSTLFQMGVPISIQNVVDLVKNPSVDAAFGTIMDFFGFGSTTFRDSNVKTGLIPENQKMSNEDFIIMVSVYAKAMQTDPETAFNRIFTGQKITRVTNGTVIVERMPLADSQAVKTKAGANNPQMKLDHTIPLELGGDNSEGNLKVVTNSEWSSYTKVENALGAALKKGKISKKDAQSEIKKFKDITNGTERKAYGDSLISKYK